MRNTKSTPSRRWVPEVRHHCPEAPIILSGNKADLRTDERALAKLKAKGAAPVPYTDAQAMCEDVGADMVLECSAKEQVGLKHVYTCCVCVHAIRV